MNLQKMTALFLACSLGFAQTGYAEPSVIRDSDGRSFVPVIAYDPAQEIVTPQTVEDILVWGYKVPFEMEFESPLSPPTPEAAFQGEPKGSAEQAPAEEELIQLYQQAKKKAAQRKRALQSRIARNDDSGPLSPASRRPRPKFSDRQPVVPFPGNLPEAAAPPTPAVGSGEAQSAEISGAKQSDSDEKDKDPLSEYGIRREDNTAQIQQQLAALAGVEANLKKQLSDAEAQTARNLADISTAAVGFVSSVAWEMGGLGALFLGGTHKEDIIKGNFQSFNDIDPFSVIAPGHPVMSAIEGLRRATLLGASLTLSETGDLFKKVLDYEDTVNSTFRPFYNGVMGFQQARERMLSTANLLSTFTGQRQYFQNKLSPEDFQKAFCLSCPVHDPAFRTNLVDEERKKMFPEDVRKAINLLRSATNVLSVANFLPDLIINALTNKMTKDHFKRELNYISSLRTAAEMGISLATEKFQSLVQEMVKNPFQQIFSGLMDGPGYFLTEIFKNTFDTVFEKLKDRLLGSAPSGDFQAYSQAIDIPFPENELEWAIQESSGLLLAGIDPAAAPPSTDGLSGKEARTYLLNGIGNAQPQGPDNAPEYMLRLESLLSGTYGFTDTQPIGLFEGANIPQYVNFSASSLVEVPPVSTLLGIVQFLQEVWPLTPAFEISKVTARIKDDLRENRVSSNDTLNLIAYSGGGQIAVEAAKFLRLTPLKYNAFFYGAPILPPAGIDVRKLIGDEDISGIEPRTITPNILSIQPVWGTLDFVVNFDALESANYSGKLFAELPLTDYNHIDIPFLKQWGYHSTNKNKIYKQTYIDRLSEVISIYFSR